MKRWKTWASALALITTGLTGIAHAAPATDPVAIVRAKDVELQKLLRSKDVSKQTARVKTLINGIFDFEEMGRRALGTATWNKMTPAQRTRFVSAFKTWVENSSVKKLEAYTSDSTRYEPAEVTGERATVTAHVYSKGSESVVVYKLFTKNNQWKAWDLVIDDLSTAGNYGDQFRDILKKESIDKLIARLESKGKADAGATAKPVDVKSKSATTPAK
jgi:phospholipid transport system substrate-binding protein